MSKTNIIKICGNCLSSTMDDKTFEKDKNYHLLRKHYKMDNICDDCYPILSQKMIDERKLLNEDSKTLCEYYHKRQKLSKTKKK